MVELRNSICIPLPWRLSVYPHTYVWELVANRIFWLVSVIFYGVLKFLEEISVQCEECREIREKLDKVNVSVWFFCVTNHFKM